LEQYLWFFVDHRQKDWPEWIASAELTINNKVHLATKISLFIANYGRELRMGADIRKKRKVEKTMEFVERIKNVQEEVGVALKKMQADKRRKKSEEWKKGDKVMLSMKDLVFKKRLARKLVDQYVGSYTIEKKVSTNTVKL